MPTWKAASILLFVGAVAITSSIYILDYTLPSRPEPNTTSAKVDNKPISTPSRNLNLPEIGDFNKGSTTRQTQNEIKQFLPVGGYSKLRIENITFADNSKGYKIDFEFENNVLDTYNGLRTKYAKWALIDGYRGETSALLERQNEQYKIRVELTKITDKSTRVLYTILIL